MEKEEQLFKKRIQELAVLAYERDIPVHTDFLTLNEQAVFQSVSATLPPVKVVFAGGSPMSERKVLCFLPSYMEEPADLPFSCLRIQPVSPRFAEALTHRDYLGSIMGLGIERSLIGDIILKDGGAFVFVMQRMAAYLCEQLTAVRKTPVTCSLWEQEGSVSGAGAGTDGGHGFFRALGRGLPPSAAGCRGQKPPRSSKGRRRP